MPGGHGAAMGGEVGGLRLAAGQLPGGHGAAQGEPQRPQAEEKHQDAEYQADPGQDVVAESLHRGGTSSGRVTVKKMASPVAAETVMENSVAPGVGFTMRSQAVLPSR